MELTVSSKTGSEQDSCLNVKFSDDSNSLTCVADVVSNLVNTPSITLTRDSSEVDTVSDHMLTHSLTDSSTGKYTCQVCINVPNARIVDHCNETELKLSTTSQYTCEAYTQQCIFPFILSPQHQNISLQCCVWTVSLSSLLTGVVLTVQI